MNDWVGCITATIGLPEPSSLFSEAVRSNSLKSTVWTHSWAAATEDLSDRGGFLVQFACHIQIIATGNQAIFDADEILTKDTPSISLPFNKAFAALSSGATFFSLFLRSIL